MTPRQYAIADIRTALLYSIDEALLRARQWARDLKTDATELFEEARS